MSDDHSVKLLSFWSSPFALRVRLGLELKGIKYELQEEDLFHQKSELLLQSNPVYKKIPVLIHKGKAISESSIILQYIDEAWPSKGPKFLPEHPLERAEVRFWADFVDKKFSSTSAASFRAVVSTGDERLKAIEELNQDWAILEELLARKKKTGEEGLQGHFFGGKEMNLVDVMLSFIPCWIPAYGCQLPDRQSYPLLHLWAEAVEKCPEAQLVYPEKHKLTAYVKQRLESYQMLKR